MTPSKLIALLPELAIFVAVVDEESFTKAGHKLGLPPSSISRSVSKLESNLEAKLLERTTRSLALNSIGRDVYKAAKSMLDSAKHAVDITQAQQQELTGELRIAAPKAFTKLILSPIVFEFMQRHPNLSIKLTASDHIIDPSSGEVDLLFRLTTHPLEGLVAKEIARVKQVICATPRYLNDKAPLTIPEDLTGHNCISLAEFEGDHVWQFERDNLTKKITTQGSFSSNHSEIRKDAVLRHIGISAFPEFTIRQEIQEGVVLPVLNDWHFAGSYQGAVYAQYTQSRYIPVQIRTFLEFAALRVKARLTA